MTLRVKLALGLAVILTAIMGLSLLLLTLNARLRVVEDYRNFAIHISDVAEAGLENAMISRNPAEIKSVLQAINRRENIEDVVILDKRGEIKFAADAGQVGQIFSMDDPTCRLCHDRGVTDRPQTIILPAGGDGRILRVARPMHNQPRCQGCHQEQILGMLLADFSLAEADREVATTQGELFLWALVTIIGVVGAAIGFVHLLIVGPLGRFVGVTQAVGRGDFSRRVGLPGKDEIGVLSASFDQMVQRIATKTRELEALNAVATTVSQSLDLDKVLQQALEKVCQVTETAWGAIHLLADATLVDEPTDELRLAASYGLPATAVEGLTRLKRGESFAGRVAQSGEPLVMDDPATDPRSGVRVEGLGSLVVVPLRAGGQVIGTLGVGSPVRRQFVPEEVAMLQVIGHQVGVAIDNARLHEETKRLAITDGLTGLYNRRHFYQVLEQELTRVARYDSHASLIMLDIDDFKRYNDTHGHLAGDRLLQDLARLLTGLTRRIDAVARYGGEEFVVILPQTDKPGAIVLAERIRTAAETQWGPGSPRDAGLPGQTGITISAGVATYPLDATTAEELVHAADMALYQAKRAGKNQVCASAVSPVGGALV